MNRLALPTFRKRASLVLITASVLYCFTPSAKEVRAARGSGGRSGSHTAAVPAAYNTAREVAFLKSVPFRATLTSIRKRLPPGAKATVRGNEDWLLMEHWDSGYHLKVTGTITGDLVFRGAQETRERRYRSSDPINSIYLEMDPRRAKRAPTKAEGEKRLAALIRLLGKPAEKEFVGDEAADSVLSRGWYALWRLRDGRTIIYDANFINEPILSLKFPYSARD